MSTPDSAASAFPKGTDSYPTSGLTKRELLAAMMAQGLLANPRVWEELRLAADVPDKALDIADALLQALSKGGPK